MKMNENLPINKYVYLVMCRLLSKERALHDKRDFQAFMNRICGWEKCFVDVLKEISLREFKLLSFESLWVVHVI